jgi:hypothetical protein
MKRYPWLHATAFLLGIAVLAGFFAKVEIAIEGANGWAVGLPTWRIESHWLLDWFWGGRPMTGYHAWMLPFSALIMHLPLLFSWRWSWRLEARCLGAICLFWVVEDALWFALNPAFGWESLRPGNPLVWWHKRWALGLPIDYWIFTMVGLALLWWSFTGNGTVRRCGGAEVRR